VSILEALADGRAWSREAIQVWVDDRVGAGAYATDKARVGANRFYQDIRALRASGLNLRFQRRRGDRGYVWPRARLARQIHEALEDLNEDMAPVLARLDSDRKIGMVADLADFARDLRAGRGLGTRSANVSETGQEGRSHWGAP
jgi:hypothetical protein